MTEEAAGRRRRVSLELPVEWLEKIDALKAEWGLRTRGDILERLLQELFSGDDGDPLQAPAAPGEGEGAGAHGPDGLPDPQGALVLLGQDGHGELVFGFDADSDERRPWHPAGADRSGGIDLPGFVRRQSHQLRRSLRPQAQQGGNDVQLPPLDADLLSQALDQAAGHWLDLYGSAPGEAVLEAAMVWLAQEVWPHSDLSEGRPFTWSLASSLMAKVAPSWPSGAASFERVMVMAGVLEDPFSPDTLVLRQPTLIRRFVQRFRRRKRGMSFETLAQTMTLHGALRQLQLPTAPGQRLTLQQIRDAYRELALANHPDSGGCDQTMRRLNEAYQLLKELYRPA